MQWFTPAIPAFWRMRQEDGEFQLVRLRLKKKK
jgi:hypothetical protein